MEKSKIRSLLSFIESASSIFHTFNKADLLPTSNSLPFEILNLYYTQSNLKENMSSSHYKQYVIPKDLSSKDPLQKISMFPLAEGFPFISYSPHKNYKAILQSFPDRVDKTKKRNTLEIYNKDSLIKSLNLDDYHEGIINNSMVGSPLIWSRNENKLLYLAEMKPEKKIGFFDSYNSLDDKQLEQAQSTFLYEPDYGEKLNNITKISIFVYDLAQGTLSQLLMPYTKIFPTNPDFTDIDGNSIIFCGFISDPVKLGILHCINRPSKIFYEEKPEFKLLFPKKTTTEENKNEDKSEKKEEEKKELKDMNALISSYETCMRPIMSPDLKKVAYYCSPLKAPHLNTVALHVYDFENKKDECIIPIVQENVFLKKPYSEVNQDQESFSGISGFYDILDKIYWLSDSKHIVFQSITGFQSDIFIVNIETKKLKKITPESSSISSNWTILGKDPVKDLLISSYENMKEALFPKAMILKNLKALSQEQDLPKSFLWDHIENNEGLNPLQISLEKLFKDKFKETHLKEGAAEGVLWSLEDYEMFSEKYAEYFPFEKESIPENKKNGGLKPLIVSVHGGPHGNASGHSLMRILFLLRGYNVLLPNFTGSCGYGQKHIENLMQKIGKIDVEEIIGMIKQAIDLKLCDPERIIVLGGSYGGYLSGIMATHPKYSSIFKAAVLLNPVVNIPFLVGISDIPEWGPAVSLAKTQWWHLESDEFKTLYEDSPIYGHCKIPCLLVLGAKDRRVPYHGSLAFRNKALLEGGDVEVFVYPESDHALAETVKVQYDVGMKILLFLEKFLDK